MIKNLFIFWLPPLFWLALIYFLSSIHASDMPEQPFDFFDKVAHFGVFGILGFLVYRAWKFATPVQNRSAMLLAFILCSVYALLDEAHQLYVPGRHAAWSDAIADILGIATAVVLGKLMYDFKEQWCERKRSNCGTTGDVTTS